MVEKKELLKPTNDYVFCRIFGYKGNEDITKDLLETITDEKYDSIEIENQIRTAKNFNSDKAGILDIRAVNNNYIFNIEMQVAKYEDMPDRMLWYWAKLYSSDIKKKQKYSEARRVISILIADFNLEVLRDIKRYHSSWHIREDELSTIILTKKFEMHIIELKKLEVNVKQQGNKKLEQWLGFIKNPGHREESCMYEEIEKARKVLEDISQDEEERKLAEQREVWEIDYNSQLYSAAKNGREEGKHEACRNNAKKMLEEGFDIDTIIRITDLSRDEIEELKADNK